jgi:hypothetical protein
MGFFACANGKRKSVKPESVSDASLITLFSCRIITTISSSYILPYPYVTRQFAGHVLLEADSDRHFVLCFSRIFFK